MLSEAKAQCDYLIVGLQVDPSLDRPEKNKPIQTLHERMIQLEAVKYIDQIIPYQSEQDLLNLIKLINPQIRIVGEDYRDKQFTGKDLTPIYYNSRKHNLSSSALRDKLSTHNTMEEARDSIPL